MTEQPHVGFKQEQVPIMRQVLGRVTKADDLEVHTCKARLDGVTVLDIREYVPSLRQYGRGTTLPWTTGTLEVLRAALRNADDPGTPDA
jgi:hypothetical protein